MIISEEYNKFSIEENKMSDAFTDVAKIRKKSKKEIKAHEGQEVVEMTLENGHKHKNRLE